MIIELEPSQPSNVAPRHHYTIEQFIADHNLDRAEIDRYKRQMIDSMRDYESDEYSADSC